MNTRERVIRFGVETGWYTNEENELLPTYSLVKIGSNIFLYAKFLKYRVGIYTEW